MEARFEILAGPSMSGKTYSLCSDTLEQARLNPNKNYILIVPEQAGNAYEKKLIEMSRDKYNIPGFFNVDILGFSRLAYRIFAEMGIKLQSVLEEYEKNMLVRVVSGELSDELEVYGKSIDRMGFIAEIKSLISEMIQYDVTPDELDECITHLPPEGTLTAKLRDVSRLYKGFLDRLVSEERLKLLRRLLRSDRECSVTDGTVFIFDEYRGYTPDQLGVINALVGRAERMTFSLCIDSGSLDNYISNGIEISRHDIFHQSFMTYRALQQAVGYKPEVRYLDRIDSGVMSPELRFLSEHIFRYPVAEYNQPLESGLSIYHTDTLEQEIRILAQEIRGEVREGYRYRDIVVVTGDIEGFDQYAGKIFSEYDIPLFSDYSRRLGRNPYTEALLRGLEVVDRDYDYSSIFGFVKTGVLKSVDTQSLNNLENYILRTGIRGSRLWNKTIRPYGRSITVEQKESCAAIDSARIKVLEALQPVLKLSRDASLVSDIVDAMLEMMKGLDYEEEMLRASERLTDQNMLTEASVMRSLYNVLVNILEQTRELLGSEVMSIHDFLEIITSGIGEVEVGVIPTTIDAVRACDVDRSRILDARVVHIIGMNDGIIPTVKKSGRILSDRDKEQVTDILFELGTGKTLASSGLQQSIDEQFLIYQLLSRATDRLTISYHDCGENGKGVEPSFLVGRICRLFPDIRIEYREEQALGGTVLSDRESFVGWMRTALDREQAGETIDDSLLSNIARYIIYTGEAEGIPYSGQLIPGLLYSNRAETIPGAVMDNITVRLSVSKLEKYASCPYSFFMRYILGLMERPEKKLEYYDIGNVVHETLENTFRDIREEYNNDWNSLDDEALRSIASDYLDMAWAESMSDEYNEDEDVSPGGKMERIRQNLHSLMDENMPVLRRHICSGEFQPDRLEQEFSAEFTARKPDGTPVPITINGKVDRIDTVEKDGGTYIRVIDYKTGSQELKPVGVELGTNIQLLVYTKIVTEILRRETEGIGVIPAGMYYYKVNSPVIDSKTGAQDFDNIQVATDKLLQSYYEQKVLTGVSNSTPMELLNLQETGLVSSDGVPGASSIINVKPGRTDGYSADTMLLEGDNIELLGQYSAQKMVESAESILSGRFDKNPVRSSGGVACDYCDYKPACRFTRYAGDEKREEKLTGSKSSKLRELAERAADKEPVELRNIKFRNQR